MITKSNDFSLRNSAAKRINQALSLQGFKIRFPPAKRIKLKDIDSRAIVDAPLTLPRLRWLVLQTDVWKWSHEAIFAAPIMRNAENGIRHLAEGLRKLRTTRRQNTNILGAWSALMTLRRSGDFGFITDPPAQGAVSLLVDEFLSFAVPTSSFLPSHECLLCLTDLECILRAAHAGYGEPGYHAETRLETFSLQFQNTLAWGEEAHSQMSGDFDFIEPEMPRLCTDDARALEWLYRYHHDARFGGAEPKGLGRFKAISVTPAYACPGEEVTIRVEGNAGAAFPITFPVPKGSASVTYLADDSGVSIENGDEAGIKLIKCTLSGITMPGKIKLSSGLGGWLDEAAIGMMPVTAWKPPRAQFLPWRGSSPTVRAYAIPTACNLQTGSTIELGWATGDTSIHASDTYMLRLRLENRPTRVKVIRTIAGNEETIWDEDYPEDSDTEVMVDLYGETTVADRDESYQVLAGNRCHRDPVGVGSYIVYRTGAMGSVSFSATTQRQLGDADEGLPEAGPRPVVFTDERIAYEIHANPGTGNFASSVAVESREGNGDWIPISAIWQGLQCTGIHETGSITLPEGEHRLRVSMERSTGDRILSNELRVAVRRAPRTLICMANGGFWIAEGLLGSSGSSSPHDGHATEDIEIAAPNVNGEMGSACDLLDLQPASSEFAATADPCNQGIPLQVLGRRLFEGTDSEAPIANRYEVYDDHGSCGSPLYREDQVDNRIVVGSYRNSTTVLSWVFDVPSSAFTYQQALDAHRDQGFEHVIFVGFSHGGAELARVTRDDWQWGSDLKLALFVAWDATDEAGAVSSIGNHDAYVLNFYQHSWPNVYWQWGGPIDNATEEYNLNGCTTHESLIMAKSVHDLTAQRISETIRSIRAEARQ